MTALEWGMLLALATIWGGSFLFNEVAVRDLPTFTVAVASGPLAPPPQPCADYPRCKSG